MKNVVNVFLSDFFPVAISWAAILVAWNRARRNNRINRINVNPKGTMMNSKMNTVPLTSRAVGSSGPVVHACMIGE